SRRTECVNQAKTKNAEGKNEEGRENRRRRHLLLSCPMVELTSKPLITDLDLKTLTMGETVRIDEKAIVTPLAVDTARERHLRIQRVAIPQGSATDTRSRKIAVGADHGGFEMKEELKKFLPTMGFEVLDLGTNSTAP